MTDIQREIRPGVWVWMIRDSAGLSPPRSSDVAESQGFPAWRAAEFLAGRTALRNLLAEVLPQARHARVAYAEGGRPYLVGWPRVGISIAHDNNTVAACVAKDFAVGVDIQHPLATVGDSLLRRCLRERAGELARLPMRRRATEFAWVWTVQEACVKAAGTGISGRPWSIDVTPRASSGQWNRYQWISMRDESPVPFSCAFTRL